MENNFEFYKQFIIEALETSNADFIIKDNEIIAKCPICGDSKSKNKKRLHYYKKDNYFGVNCFNGGCEVKNLHPYKFLKLYYSDICKRIKQNNLREFIEYKENLNKQFTTEVNNFNKQIEVVDNFFKEAYNNYGIKELQSFLKSLNEEQLNYFKKCLNS